MKHKSHKNNSQGKSKTNLICVCVCCYVVFVFFSRLDNFKKFKHKFFFILFHNIKIMDFGADFDEDLFDSKPRKNNTDLSETIKNYKVKEVYAKVLRCIF